MFQEKYSNYSVHDHVLPPPSLSPRRKRTVEKEINPFTPIIVEELLQSPMEWKEVSDIVKITLQAISDVIRVQGETLRDLEKQIVSKASKSELNNGLSAKASISEVSKTLTEFLADINNKPSWEELNIHLRDYVLCSDLQDSLDSKPSMEEVKEMLQKSGQLITKAELDEVTNYISEKIGAMEAKISDFTALRERNTYTSVAVQKNILSANQIYELLECKANKQTVAASLHKKANKADIEALLGKKADKEAMLQLQQKLEKLERKMDISKKEGSDVSKFEFDILADSVSIQKIDIQKARLELERNFEFLKSELDTIKHRNSLTNSTKHTDQSDIDHIHQLLSQKPDISQVNHSMIQLREDISEEINALREEVLLHLKENAERYLKKASDTDQLFENISSEFTQLKNQIKRMLEEAGRRTQTEEQRSYFGDFDELSHIKNTQGTDAVNFQRCYEELQQKLLSQISRIEDEIEHLKGFQDSQMEELNKIVSHQVDSLRQELHRELDNLHLQQSLGSQGTQEDTDHREGILMKLQEQLESKTDLGEVQEALNILSNDITKKFALMKEDFTQLMKALEEEMFVALKKKATVADLHAAMEKIDSSYQGIQPKIMDHCQQSGQIDDDNWSGFQEQIRELRNEVSRKLDSDDAIVLFDSKLSSEEFNRVVKRLQEEINLKASQEELKDIASEQALVIESLCTENIIGRWAWRSAEIDSQGLVPWDIQMTNTLPDNFLWEKGTTHVISVAPGLYELAFGFFTESKPMIKIFVNDEVITARGQTENQKTFEGAQSKTKESSIGLTGIDYLILPPKAKISFCYIGEVSGEGFFSLKRL